MNTRYIVGLTGTQLTDEERLLLQKDELAGVILYGVNTAFPDPDGLVTFIREIKEAGHPELIVSIDEEGGFVSRLIHLLPNWSAPYMAHVLRENPADEKIIRNYIFERSQMLKEWGVDLNFAPVADYFPTIQDDTYRRGLGWGDPAMVVTLGKMWLEEQSKAGLRSCLKHFPGIGRTSVDTHEELPVISVTEQEWMNHEGMIFRELITAGADMVMVGHIINRDMGPMTPSSISSYWVNRLRQLVPDTKLTVITDELGMGALGGVEVNARTLNEASLDVAIIKKQDHPIIQDLLGKTAIPPEKE